MSSRHVVAVITLAAALVGGLVLSTATAATAAANPIPLPVIDTLINEGISVEGPLINNIVLPGGPP